MIKDTITNKVLLFSGIVAGITLAAYYANNKNRTYAIAGAGLGVLVATLAMPKIITLKAV